MAVKDGNGGSSYQGAVLATRERSGHDDSDFYAVVWDEERGAVTTVEYASTRYGGGGSAEVDATLEVIEKARAWWRAAKASDLEAALRDVRSVRDGDEVRVVKGRKLPLGTVGRVFWRGANPFRTYYRNGYNRPESLDNQRVGVETAGGLRTFLALENVEKVVDEEALKAEVAERVERADPDGYERAFAAPGWAVM